MDLNGNFESLFWNQQIIDKVNKSAKMQSAVDLAVQQLNNVQKHTSNAINIARLQKLIELSAVQNNAKISNANALNLALKAISPYMVNHKSTFKNPISVHWLNTPIFKFAENFTLKVPEDQFENYYESVQDKTIELNDVVIAENLDHINNLIEESANELETIDKSGDSFAIERIMKLILNKLSLKGISFEQKGIIITIIIAAIQLSYDVFSTDEKETTSTKVENRFYGSENKYKTVMGETTLFSKPEKKSKVILTLPVGVSLEVISSKRIWVKVNYVDFKGDTLSGWVLKEKIE